MKENKGVIYILTNPSFEQYVKIGYADDIEQRLKQLNRTECTPYAFRVYATYEVDTRLTDMKIHDMIDILNPSLRAIDTINGKKRVREFYAMSAEDAYKMFEAMAEIHGTTDKLKLIELTDAEKFEEEKAGKIRKAAAPFTFDMVNISSGEEVEFWPNINEGSGIFAVVCDSKHVTYEGETYTLSGLTKKLLNRSDNSFRGPQYFKYKDRWLNDLRAEMNE